MHVPKLRLLLVILLGLAVFAGWRGMYPIPFKDVFSGGGEKVTDTSILDRYRVDFDLQPDGRLSSTEYLDVQFTSYGKHGIYRIFDTQDAQYRSIEHPVTVVSVDRKRQGEWVAEPYIVSQEGGGTMTIRIGSESRTFDPGVQKYRIVSETTNAITHPKDGPDGAGGQWYWDVVGSGWSMPMRSVEVSATIPSTIASPICEASVPCEIRQSDGGYRISMTNLPAYTPVTMKAFFAQQAPSPARSAKQYLLLGATAGFVLLSLLLTGLTFARSRERRPSIQPRFEPPAADPLPCTWTLDEAPSGRGVPTVLLNLVAQGALDFTAEPRSVYDSNGPDWIQLTRTPQPLPDLLGFTAAVNDLGLTQPGATRVITKKNVEDGKVLHALDAQISRETLDLVMREGYATKVHGAGLALFLTTAAILGGFAALIWLPGGLLVALLLLVAGVAGLFISRHDTTRLSEAGAGIRDATAGFRQVLSTPASTERFDYAARVRHFDEYLPWAVAFDCADEWAASCTPPPGSPEAEGMTGTSHMYYSPTQTSRMWALSSGVTAVEASAVAAYQATQSSSSSGGGGGGGGSGGGGGGSW
ncbi:MAG TPA: DUF2207 domain-containing protein [Actinomycetota bacterium]|nr:DUF2207 domain-containing protein [Actinomycetota bacterium]